MATVKNRWEGARVNAGGIAGSSVNVNKLNLDPDQDNIDDFATGSGIIVASKTETYCARIKQITPDPVPGGTNNTITFYSSDATTYLTSTAGGYLQAVPANVYELDKDTLELSRNGMLLASQIEDFQTEFWVDGSGVPNNMDDGDAEFPVNDLEHPDPPGGGLMAQNDRIRRVRVTVLAVAPLEDQQNSATGHLSYGRPKIANRDAATVVGSASPARFQRQHHAAQRDRRVRPGDLMTHNELKTRVVCGPRDESGMALLIAVILLLLMSALGLAALQHSGDESAGSGRSRRKDATLYAAEAGQAMAQGRMFAQWDAMASADIFVDEPAMVTDAFGNPIAVRSGVPGPAGLPATPAKIDQSDNGIKSASKQKDGFMLNIGNANSRSFKSQRVDIVAQDTGNGLVHLLAQYSVMSN